MNMQQMMKQAQKMQEQLQKQMEATVVDATAGGGMVSVKMNGSKQLLAIQIDPEVFASVLADRRPDSEPPTAPPSESEGPAAGAAKARPLESLESNMRKHVLAALERSNWVIDGPHGAAKALALHPNTLRSRLKKLGIVRAAPQGEK